MGPNRRRRRRPQNGLLKCTKIVRRCTKLPFWGLFNTPPPTYLNPTKCFEPTSSDYTRPWKLWLASETSIGGAGGGPKMAVWLKCTKSVRNCNKLPSLGLCSNPQPTYLNPTKYFQPMSSDYSRPWKLWLGSGSSIGGSGGGTKIPFRALSRTKIVRILAHFGPLWEVWIGFFLVFRTLAL